MKKLLALPEQPTAVFCSKDTMAIGAYDAIYETGLTVPGDISIASHDDIEACKALRPKLTTMSTHRHQLGEAAVELLFKQIAAKDNRSEELVFVPDLIVRDSTAPPREGTPPR